ncbi:hypothetical protein ACN27G_01540 [Plantactinospora sp. WMMB334]|uniref:hypothetical protein n=1 Tax=Plantactinospora sp. WMMB334 TaxID=3404119 RepID=UPI003B947FCB
MSSVGEVVSRLSKVIERLDRGAVGASRGQAEADQVHGILGDVARGSDHALVRAAIVASSEAAAKAGKAARLLSEAADHFASYANEIAPGSVPSRGRATDSAPGGEQLVQEAERAEDGFRRFAKRTTHQAESIGEKVKDLVDFLAEARPDGTTSTTQKLPPPPRNPTAVGTPGDAAEALAVTAAAALAVVLKAASLRKERRERERG